MRRLLAGVAVAALVLSTVPAIAAPDASKLKADALVIADGLKAPVAGMSQAVWTFSELGLRETKSSAYLADVLEKEGFKVERGVAGMPTAFVATFERGGPVIGVLAEFDALPGIGNVAEPHQHERADGVTNGHGCGHNVFGAASVGGAIALKRLIEQKGLKGTIKLFGTPAEEPDLGKLYMAKAGVFKGVDVAIEWHPMYVTATNNDGGLALNNFEVEMFGRAAHASADPENGRSALDGLELFTHGVNMLREHVPTTVRMHYAILDGGKVANIVPDYARLVMNVRGVDRKSVDETYARVLKIVDGASSAMEVKAKVTLSSALHEVVLNRPLQEAMQANLERLGEVKFSDADQAFAHSLQTDLKIEPKGYDGKIVPLAAQPGFSAGSTDVAEVSRIAPTVGFVASTAPAGIPWHSWSSTASHGAPSAQPGTMFAVKAITLMGVDLLTRPDLIAAAKVEFVKQTHGEPYVPGIPMDQQPPVPKS
jgi:aminobenzoyl-glutamate utilization protein B